MITLPQKICATCFSLSCLPSLVMLLSETHVVLLIKDKQCTDIHPNRPRSHQTICALFTKPTATFGAGRHSPNVQLHVLPAVVFIVVALVIHPLHSICSSLNWLPSCPPACPPATVIRIVVSSRRAGRRRGGGPRGKLSRLSSETKCCGAFRHPARTVFDSPERTQSQTRETRIQSKNITNYKVRHIITTNTNV